VSQVTFKNKRHFMIADCRKNVHYMHHNSCPKTHLRRQQKKSMKMPKVDYLSSKLSLACHIELLQSLAWPSILRPLCSASRPCVADDPTLISHGRTSQYLSIGRIRTSDQPIQIRGHINKG
jgi:hypothetical protein